MPMARAEIKHILWLGGLSPHDIEDCAGFFTRALAPVMAVLRIDPLASPRITGAVEDGAVMAFTVQKKPVNFTDGEFEHAEIGKAILVATRGLPSDWFARGLTGVKNPCGGILPFP